MPLLAQWHLSQNALATPGLQMIHVHPCLPNSTHDINTPESNEVVLEDIQSRSFFPRRLCSHLLKDAISHHFWNFFKRDESPIKSNHCFYAALSKFQTINQQTTFKFSLKVHWSPWSNTHCSISLQNQGWVAEKSAKLVLHTMWLPVSPFSQLNGESWIRG